MERHRPWCPMKPDCETSRMFWHVPCCSHLVSQECFWFVPPSHSISSGIQLPCMLTSQRPSSRRGRTRFKHSIRKPSLVKSPSCFAPHTASWVAWQIETYVSLMSVHLILEAISSSMVLRRYAVMSSHIVASVAPGSYGKTSSTKSMLIFNLLSHWPVSIGTCKWWHRHQGFC